MIRFVDMTETDEYKKLYEERDGFRLSLKGYDELTRDFFKMYPHEIRKSATIIGMVGNTGTKYHVLYAKYILLHVNGAEVGVATDVESTCGAQKNIYNIFKRSQLVAVALKTEETMPLITCAKCRGARNKKEN